MCVCLQVGQQKGLVPDIIRASEWRVWASKGPRCNGHRGHGVVSTVGQHGRVASGAPSVSMSASEAADVLEPGNRIKCRCGTIEKGASGAPMCWESKWG